MNDGFMYESLVVIHAVAGIGGLIGFWAPALAKKGGRVHRGAGKLFLFAMLLVTLTGIPLAMVLFTQGQWVVAVFLLYLAVLLAASTGSAWAALKLKREPERFYGGAYLATAWLLLLAGLTVSVLGYAFGVTLLLIFGLIGPFSAFDMFKRRHTKVRASNWWLMEHFGGMIGGGIATHVAFGAFGLQQLWPAYASLDGWIGMLPWILPVVVGIIATVLLERHYARPAPAAGVTT